jgi:hypothetical protein
MSINTMKLLHGEYKHYISLYIMYVLEKLQENTILCLENAYIQIFCLMNNRLHLFLCV